MAELVFDKYLEHPACRKSFMVCKSCGAQDMQNVTFSSTENALHVWCFTSGRLENIVRSSLSLLSLSECTGSGGLLKTLLEARARALERAHQVRNLWI